MHLTLVRVRMLRAIEDDINVAALAVATSVVSTFPALARRPHLPAYDVSATAVAEFHVQPSMLTDPVLR